MARILDRQGDYREIDKSSRNSIVNTTYRELCVRLFCRNARERVIPGAFSSSTEESPLMALWPVCIRRIFITFQLTRYFGQSLLSAADIYSRSIGWLYMPKGTARGLFKLSANRSRQEVSNYISTRCQWKQIRDPGHNLAEKCSTMRNSFLHFRPPSRPVPFNPIASCHLLYSFDYKTFQTIIKT